MASSAASAFDVGESLSVKHLMYRNIHLLTQCDSSFVLKQYEGF